MEKRKRAKEVRVSYTDVHDDPDIEFLGSDGKFPSETVDDTSKGDFLFYLVIILIAVVIMIVVGEITKEKKKENVVNLPAMSSTVEVSPVGATEKPDAPHVTITRVQEGPLKNSNIAESYFIDGYDYGPYNMGEKSLAQVMDELGFYDSPRLLASTFYNGIIDVLSSNNLYRLHKENGSYVFYLYLPKKEAEISVDETYSYLNVIPVDGENVYAITLLHGIDTVGEDIPIVVHILYEDGERNDFVLHVAKDYIS